MATTNETTGARMVRLNGREYRVEVTGEDNGRPRYLLTGKRGARYFTMRNVPNPDLLFIVAESIGSAPFRGQWFTDIGGDLRRVGF
jgi:hypothetical protein